MTENSHTSSAEVERPHVVVVGGGFAGLACVQALKKAPVRVTLVDRRNFHLFQPLLYQVATGALSPANIATPLRKVLDRQKNVRVLLGEVAAIDTTARQIFLGDRALTYDFLVIATGAENFYFGHGADWSKHAPGLKTVEDATQIRHQILSAFEAAELTEDPERIRHLLTFAIVGAGPTGVELAGAISEIARHTLRREFHTIDPADAHVVLLEFADHVLPTYPEDLSEDARRMLERLGVDVRTGARVTDITDGCVDYSTSEGPQQLRAGTILWAAGVKASPLGKMLSDAIGTEPAKGGRIQVGPDLSLPTRPEIFVAGDLAQVLDGDGTPLPGVAPVAMQQGQYVGRLIARRLNDEEVEPFRYFDAGTAATIGRGKAVAIIFGQHLRGLLAWLGWLLIHLMKLVSFENRVLVFMQWAWNYTTRNRSARLITGSYRKDD